MLALKCAHSGPHAVTNSRIFKNKNHFIKSTVSLMKLNCLTFVLLFHSAVNGSWTQWEDISECTGPCSNATIMQRRNCTNPAPSNEGSYCQGLGTRSISCVPNQCQGGNYGGRDGGERKRKGGRE